MSDEQFLISNAKIWHTGHEDHEWMIFNQTSGYITDIGSGEAPESPNIPSARRQDCGGSRVLPGFHESHIHVAHLGRHIKGLKLNGCQSIEELKSALSDYAGGNPNVKVLVGAGWDQGSLGRYPHREDLDQVCPDIPVVLYRVCTHATALNSKALEIGQITKYYTAPAGGSFDKYHEGHPLAGEPNGLLREFLPSELQALCHSATLEEEKDRVRTGLRSCLANGVTSVHACEEDRWPAFCSLVDSEELHQRVFYCAFWDHRSSDGYPEAGQKHGDFLSCDRIKLFADGALGPCTAALSQPYKHSDDGNVGALLQSQETLDGYVKEATTSGYRLEIHVIGDAAAEAAILAMERSRVTPEKRPILTHAQILRPDLIERMKKLGVIANIQPQFMTTDARLAMRVLPQSLLDYSYIWKTLLEQGIVCAGGSDAPVETPEPMKGMYDAIYRPIEKPSTGKEETFKPDECLSVRQAIDLYTKAGAYTAMREHCLGQLLLGYQADFILLDADVVEQPRRLLDAKVTEAWVAGQRRL